MDYNIFLLYNVKIIQCNEWMFNDTPADENLQIYKLYF